MTASLNLLNKRIWARVRCYQLFVRLKAGLAEQPTGVGGQGAMELPLLHLAPPLTLLPRIRTPLLEVEQVHKSFVHNVWTLLKAQWTWGLSALSKVTACRPSSWKMFSFSILSRLQPQNLDQTSTPQSRPTSSSKSQPEIDPRILTKFCWSLEPFPSKIIN